MRVFIAVLMMIAVVVLPACAAQVEEEKYPSKPITIYVVYGVGGMTDVSIRLVADEMKGIAGQPITVVNKKGGSGTVGLHYFLTLETDSYAMCAGDTSAFMAPLFLEAEPFDLDKFSYVGGHMSGERVLMCPAEAPYQTFEEFITYAKEHPGEVSVGSAADQPAFEVLKSIAVKENLDMNYVMFDSGADASANLLGRHVDVCETGAGTPAFQAVRTGDLRILINLGIGSVPYFPEVRNLKDLGYPFSSMIEFGFVMHAGVPESVRQYWEDTLGKALESPEVSGKLSDMGVSPKLLPGSEWEKMIRDAVASIDELYEYNKALEK